MPDEKKPSEKINDSTISTLKEEGIEIGDVGGHVEENEFTDIPTPAQPNIGETVVEVTADSIEEAVPDTSTTPTPAPEIQTPIKPKNTPPKSPEPPVIQVVDKKPEPQAVTKQPEPLAVNNPSIRQLRTFRMDAEEAVRSRKISTADIAIAEQKKREATPIEYVEHGGGKKRMVITLVFTLLLIFVALGGFFYWKGGVEPEATVRGSLPAPLIPSESAVPISAQIGNVLSSVAEKSKNVSASVGSIVYLPVVDVSSTTKQQSIQSVFSGTRAPLRLIRSLSDEYTFGVHIFDGTVPFIILKTSLFQNAFPGMLEWEKDMRNDLLSLIQTHHPNVKAVSTDNDRFRDGVIENIDIRILDDENNVPMLMYGFADRNTIVITFNEKSMRELLRKLLSVRVVQ